jgi:hypothetical protein
VAGGGKVNIVPPLANFKTLVNKNALKPEIGGPPSSQFFLKAALTPLGIFNPCASMKLQVVVMLVTGGCFDRLIRKYGCI